MSTTDNTLNPFHLAIPVSDLAAADAFYCGLLGCAKGRTASRWIDLNFHGHQVTLHLVDAAAGGPGMNPVDGDQVPARHFGVVLPMPEWQALADKLESCGYEFLIAPKVRFKGEIGEQATLFILDPAGNALEFKSFADPAMLFAT
ncbi:MAG: VOC family protein [Gammaproteobacteria bacterium]|nr:VOC family protein [Gammaproteobacteria bacterium]MDH3428502.1 VOC family protein [Gammaproteobacteria bacterium]MDH3433020.1 VOC family protein [Gammaproteobacteria bacterium]